MKRSVTQDVRRARLGRARAPEIFGLALGMALLMVSQVVSAQTSCASGNCFWGGGAPTYQMSSTELEAQFIDKDTFDYSIHMESMGDCVSGENAIFRVDANVEGTGQIFTQWNIFGLRFEIQDWSGGQIQTLSSVDSWPLGLGVPMQFGGASFGLGPESDVFVISVIAMTFDQFQRGEEPAVVASYASQTAECMPYSGGGGGTYAGPGDIVPPWVAAGSTGLTAGQQYGSAAGGWSGFLCSPAFPPGVGQPCRFAVNIHHWIHTNLAGYSTVWYELSSEVEAGLRWTQMPGVHPQGATNYPAHSCAAFGEFPIVPGSMGNCSFSGVLGCEPLLSYPHIYWTNEDVARDVNGFRVLRDLMADEIARGGGPC